MPGGSIVSSVVEQSPLLTGQDPPESSENQSGFDWAAAACHAPVCVTSCMSVAWRALGVSFPSAVKSEPVLLMSFLERGHCCAMNLPPSLCADRAAKRHSNSIICCYEEGKDYIFRKENSNCSSPCRSFKMLNIFGLFCVCRHSSWKIVD